MPDTPAPRIVAAADLERFVARCMQAAGLPDEDAATVARLMTAADLRGADGHGVFRLNQYCKRIKAGGINVRPNIRIVSERKAQALIDGDNGMGHVVMKRAADIAIAKAKETGVAWVGARMSNHAGPAALYAHDAAGTRHARALRRDGQRQSRAAVGRHRHAAVDQPDRDCGARRTSGRRSCSTWRRRRRPTARSRWRCSAASRCRSAG